MTGKERILTALRVEKPDRVPLGVFNWQHVVRCGLRFQVSVFRCQDFVLSRLVVSVCSDSSGSDIQDIKTDFSLAVYPP